MLPEGLEWLAVPPWVVRYLVGLSLRFPHPYEYIIPQLERKVNSFFKKIFDRFRRTTSKSSVNKEDGFPSSIFICRMRSILLNLLHPRNHSWTISEQVFPQHNKT